MHKKLDVINKFLEHFINYFIKNGVKKTFVTILNSII